MPHGMPSYTKGDTIYHAANIGKMISESGHVIVRESFGQLRSFADPSGVPLL